MDEEQLLDYDEEQTEVNAEAPAGENGDSTKLKGNYASIHSSGFRDLMLRPELLRAIMDCGFEHPSEVQHECIPQAILGMDIICQAKSGMGKTAVFVLATLQQLQPEDGVVSVLVMCHTRELAFQISKEYERFSKYLASVKVAVFFGGMPIKKDEETLKNNTPHVVVGTPGRLLALARSGALKLKSIKYFVLDECDKMIGDIDMRRDVQEVFKMTPQEKQVMMFSATLPKDLRVICKKFMQEPMEVYVDDEAKLTLHGLQQYYVKLKENEKTKKLLELLDVLEFNQVVIFLRSVPRCKALDKLLTDQNFPSIAIHRQLPQEERLARYQKFKDFQSRILVATDLFGRGMDIERVNIVFNYDMPEDTDSYLHRVARAGRFGTKGLAITFVSDEEDAEVLNKVQDRFDVTIPELPAQIDVSTYSKFRFHSPLSLVSRTGKSILLVYITRGNINADVNPTITAMGYGVSYSSNIRMGTPKEEWVSFDSELKIDGETGVADDPLKEVSLDEEKPPVPPRTKTPEAVAEITVSKQEETAPRRLSIDAGIKSGDVEPRPIRNSKILATVFPTNAHFAWIVPPKYDPTKLPQTLSASEVGLQADVFSLVMRHITDDIRFKAYAVAFSRILPMWVVFSIIVLLAMLISSPDGGFSVMVMTFFWVIMLLIGVFFGIIIRKHLKIGLAQVVSEANKHLLHHNLIVGVQDRGQLSCHKVVIIFMYYQTQECLVDIEKQLRIANSTAKPKPVLMTHEEMTNACDQLLRDHIQTYIKSFVKRRLLFPTRPSEGVSDFRPKHSPKNHCLCQFVEEEYFNDYKKTWYEKLV